MAVVLLNVRTASAWPVWVKCVRVCVCVCVCVCIVHVAAVLSKVEVAVKLGFTKCSSISEACKWNRQFRRELEMIPFPLVKWAP